MKRKLDKDGQVTFFWFLCFIYILDDWARFEHAGEKIFEDFELVRKEIEDETDRLTGTNKVSMQKSEIWKNSQLFYD